MASCCVCRDGGDGGGDACEASASQKLNNF